MAEAFRLRPFDFTPILGSLRYIFSATATAKTKLHPVSDQLSAVSQKAKAGLNTYLDWYSGKVIIIEEKMDICKEI